MDVFPVCPSRPGPWRSAWRPLVPMSGKAFSLTPDNLTWPYRDDATLPPLRSNQRS